MKTFTIVQFSVLAFASGIVTGLTLFTGNMASHYWVSLFGDGNIPLPIITILSMHYGYIIPLICCFCSIVFVFISIKKHGDLCFLWRIFTLITIIELISLALISWFNFYPTIKIMYKLM